MEDFYQNKFAIENLHVVNEIKSESFVSEMCFNIIDEFYASYS